MYGDFIFKSLVKFARRLSEKSSQKSAIPKVVFVLGSPCSGKSTQCQLLSKEFGFKHLSHDDLILEERESPKSELEKKIKDTGSISTPLELKVLRSAMAISGRSKFLIEGFPRNKAHFRRWTKTMSEYVDIPFVLFLNCPYRETFQRCLRIRATGNYINTNLDDLLDKISIYERETVPLVTRLRNNGIVQQVDGEKSPEKVYKLVREHFKHL